MTVRQKVFQYKFQHAIPLVVVLADIIPLYFFPKAVVMPAVAALENWTFQLGNGKCSLDLVKTVGSIKQI